MISIIIFLYRPLVNNNESDYYNCVENHFEKLEGVWDERFKSKYRLKIYNVDPLKCDKCGNKMRIISSIEEEFIIKKFLNI